MVALATSDLAAAQDIGRVALDYRDTGGEQMAVITAPAEVLRQYARGEISEETVMDALYMGFSPEKIFQTYGEMLQ